MTRDEAIKWLDNLTQDIGQMRHQDLWDYAQALGEICQMIEDTPEIVRCKDCKHYIKPYCARWMVGLTPEDDDAFCAWAERKETK